MSDGTASEPGQVVRSARVAWLTQPPAGDGRITLESRAFGSISMSVPEAATGAQETTPGELLAGAHATMMATALAGLLEKLGTPARELWSLRTPLSTVRGPNARSSRSTSMCTRACRASDRRRSRRPLHRRASAIYACAARAGTSTER